jgi:hypothetical protein
MRLWVFRAVCGVLGSLVAGCSAVTCQPAPVTVAQKEERSHMEMVSKGLGTSPTGRVEELRVPEVVREYWVRAPDGTWHRVSADQYRGVEVGGSVEVCR